jgi:hypothetical protein
MGTTMITAALGWLGMAGTFGAYVLLWRGRLASESLTYSLLNTVGGLLGGMASAAYGAWPSVASNLVWAAVGLHGVVTALRRRGAVPLVTLAAAEQAPVPQTELVA